MGSSRESSPIVGTASSSDYNILNTELLVGIHSAIEASIDAGHLSTLVQLHIVRPQSLTSTR